jgi:hypothetical protein
MLKKEKPDFFTGPEPSPWSCMVLYQRKIELIEETGDAALPLEAKSGTAQLDFGKPFKHNEKIIDLPLSYSFLPI